VDPLKAKAALDGMGQLLDSDSLGHALGLLRGPAFDQVLGHAALVDAIRNSARAGNLIDLLSLSDHAHEGVRALALDCLGRLTLPDSTDPKLRADLGNRVSAKLTPTTPPVELAAALGAVKNLRLSGASESVIQLARQREALALPGIDDQFWIHCLGDAFILPHGADEANDRLVSRLAECVDDPALLPIAAAAIGRIRDPDLISLRKGLDALARHLAPPAAMIPSAGSTSWPRTVRATSASPTSAPTSSPTGAPSASATAARSSARSRPISTRPARSSRPGSTIRTSPPPWACRRSRSRMCSATSRS